MPAFLCTVAATNLRPRVNKVDAMVVFANDATDAKAMCASKFDGDLDWANATATQIVAGANLNGWKVRIQLVKPDGTIPFDVSVTGNATDDTIDEIAALMVVALNATAINNASYSSATNVLTIASAADNIGDHKIVCSFLPPATLNEDPQPVPGFVGALVHQGVAAAALTVTFAADAFVVPSDPVLLQQRS